LFPEPDEFVPHVVGARFLVATDCLLGAAEIVRSKKTGVFSLWPVGRAVLEAAGRAYWLLEPDLDYRSRFARALNGRLDSLSGAVRFRERGNIPDTEVLMDPEAMIEQIRQQAKASGFELTGKGRYVRVKEEPIPSDTDLVDGLTFPGVYSLFSGYSHSELWTVSHHQEPVEIEDPAGKGRHFSQVTQSLAEVQLFCKTLVDGFNRAADAAVNYYGWNDEEWGRIKQIAAGNLNTVLP
jgi:hypothetical protein